MNTEMTHDVATEVAKMPEPEMPKQQMPQPQTMNYDQTVKFTDKFVNDMHAALDSFAFVEVNELYKMVDTFKDSMPINIANDIIRRIASFPYNRVASFMHGFEQNQNEYVQLNVQENKQA